jgi:hypothetical protein
MPYIYARNPIYMYIGRLVFHADDTTIGLVHSRTTVEIRRCSVFSSRLDFTHLRIQPLDQLRVTLLSACIIEV